MDHILFTHSSVDRPLGCFYFSAVVINVAVNICAQLIFLNERLSIYYIPGSVLGFGRVRDD